MDHKIQRVASIIIGIIISLLLLFVVVRVAQKRQTRATAAKNLTCIINSSEGIVTYTSADPEPGIVNYTTEASYNANQQFSFIAEADNSPNQVEGGVYEQEIKIGPLVANTNYVIKVGDQIVTCTLSGGQAAGSTTPVPSKRVTSKPVEPTKESVVEEMLPSPTGTTSDEDEEPAVQAASSGLPSEEVNTFYEDNPDASIKGCSDEFKDDKDSNGKYYTNLGQICAEGWAKKNL